MCRSPLLIDLAFAKVRYINIDINERIGMSDRTSIADFGSFNAKRLSLTIDAFTGGALVVDGVVERPVAVEQGAHQAAFLPIGIFDAAFAFGELGVLTGLSRARRKEQGAAKALSQKAVGVAKLKDGVHAQALRAVR